ncbi:hypothetical protein GCM10028783_19170 [Modestobacter muralis]
MSTSRAARRPRDRGPQADGGVPPSALQAGLPPAAVEVTSEPTSRNRVQLRRHTGLSPSEYRARFAARLEPARDDRPLPR